MPSRSSSRRPSTTKQAHCRTSPLGPNAECGVETGARSTAAAAVSHNKKRGEPCPIWYLISCCGMVLESAGGPETKRNGGCIWKCSDRCKVDIDRTENYGVNKWELGGQKENMQTRRPSVARLITFHNRLFPLSPFSPSPLSPLLSLPCSPSRRGRVGDWSCRGSRQCEKREYARTEYEPNGR